MSPRMGLTRDKIMETAGEIADQKGIEEVTIANLAKTLKIRPPSLYNHIKGLNELRTVLAVHGLESLYKNMEAAIKGKAGDEAVQALGKSYLQFARKHPGLYDAALLSPDPNGAAVQGAGNQIVELALGSMAYLDLPKENALHAVRGLRSLFHGFASLEQKGGFGLELSVDQSFAIMIDSFLTGVRLKQEKER
ncbi:TetR/AcrR family transcriptional regulator [Bacillus sp. AK031]